MGRTQVFIILMLLLPYMAEVSGARVPSVKFEPQTTDLHLKIDFGNETILEFPSVNGTTVLNATRAVVSVEADWYADNVFVTAIAGVSNDADAGLWWQYWVNDELAPVAANKYIPQQGDEIAWRRAPPQSADDGTTDIDVSTLAALLLLPIVAIGVVLFLKNRSTE